MKIYNNKSQGLPINVLVMIIIGIIIFSIGFALFNKLYNQGDETIDKLNLQVKNNIEELHCQNDEWICAPNFKIKNGKQETFLIYIVNNADTKKKYNVKINDDTSWEQKISNEDCGSVELKYPANNEISIDSGKSAEVPFIINANKVQPPCSFITKAEIIDELDNIKGQTPIIIRVEI